MFGGAVTMLVFMRRVSKTRNLAISCLNSFNYLRELEIAVWRDIS